MIFLVSYLTVKHVYTYSIYCESSAMHGQFAVFLVHTWPPIPPTLSSQCGQIESHLFAGIHLKLNSRNMMPLSFTTAHLTRCINSTVDTSSYAYSGLFVVESSIFLPNYQLPLWAMNFVLSCKMSVFLGTPKAYSLLKQHWGWPPQQMHCKLGGCVRTKAESACAYKELCNPIAPCYKLLSCDVTLWQVRCKP